MSNSKIIVILLALTFCLFVSREVSCFQKHPSSSSPVLSLSSKTSQQNLPQEARIKSNDIIKFFAQIERTARQLPSVWSGLFSKRETGLSRQIFDMIDIVTDVAMLTLIGIPILGLVAVGATALQPLLGSAAGRKKRDTSSSHPDGIIDRAGKAILYARNLYDILADLEETFDKYEIKTNDCQLRAICEVHRVGPNSDYKDFGEKIIDIVKMEKEVEEHETIPLAKMFFQLYADAANHGNSQERDCSQIYRNCEQDIASLVVSKLRQQVKNPEEDTAKRSL